MINRAGINSTGKDGRNARQQGRGRDRVCYNIDRGIDEKTLETLCFEVSGSSIGHEPVLPNLLTEGLGRVSSGKGPQAIARSEHQGPTDPARFDIDPMHRMP
jgi:hypothetical protein